MTYAETARRFVRASESTRAGAAPDAATLAADNLPMSPWAESRRVLMSPQTIAANHALHVSDAADDLASAIASYARGTADERTGAGDALANAARVILRAIGEGAAL